jgi:hypothetical protein
MTKPKYRRRVSKEAPKPEVPRKNRDHKGVPQMMVALSALPEFGGRACSLTTSYKFCDGAIVSARLLPVMKEAMRRLRIKEHAA